MQYYKRDIVNITQILYALCCREGPSGVHVFYYHYWKIKNAFQLKKKLAADSIYQSIQTQHGHIVYIVDQDLLYINIRYEK